MSRVLKNESKFHHVSIFLHVFLPIYVDFGKWIHRDNLLSDVSVNLLLVEPRFQVLECFFEKSRLNSGELPRKTCQTCISHLEKRCFRDFLQHYKVSVPFPRYNVHPAEGNCVSTPKKETRESALVSYFLPPVLWGPASVSGGRPDCFSNRQTPDFLKQ